MECLLCTNKIDYFAVGECNHSQVCSTCVYRMRFVLADYTCAICQQDIPNVVVSDTKQSFAEYNVWGSTAGPDVIVHNKVQVYFKNCKVEEQRLLNLTKFTCRVHNCTEKFDTGKLLEKHMQMVHKRQFCKLCFESQAFFIQEQPVYTNNQLKRHNKENVNPMNKITERHPQCKFCCRRYVNATKLYEHLEKEHFSCHLCEAKHQYYSK